MLRIMLAMLIVAGCFFCTAQVAEASHEAVILESNACAPLQLESVQAVEADEHAVQSRNGVVKRFRERAKHRRALSKYLRDPQQQNVLFVKQEVQQEKTLKALVVRRQQVIRQPVVSHYRIEQVSPVDPCASLADPCAPPTLAD